MERTRLGAMIRAGVDDLQMARAVGIPVSRLFTTVFCLGAALAGAGGVIGGPIMSAYPGLDADMLPLALIVVILGGVGSLLGAFVGGFIIGFVYTFGVGAAARPRVRDPLPADDPGDRLPAARACSGSSPREVARRFCSCSRRCCRSSAGEYYINLASQIVIFAVFAREHQSAARLWRPADARPRRRISASPRISRRWLQLKMGWGHVAAAPVALLGTDADGVRRSALIALRATGPRLPDADARAVAGAVGHGLPLGIA